MSDKKKLLLWVWIVAFLLAGWGVGYHFLHEGDCCPSASLGIELNSNCDNGTIEEQMKCAMKGQGVGLPVCTRCNKWLYDIVLLEVLVTTEIMLCLSLKNEKNKKAAGHGLSNKKKLMALAIVAIVSLILIVAVRWIVFAVLDKVS